MPPVLEPEKSKVDGLAFIGLSLSRASILGHPGSITHQDAFDLNEVMDRDYEFIYSTDDNGWLAGGGEPGAPKSYKLAAKDSSHVELMRIGTYNPAWGGVSEDEIVKVLKSGKILIPQIEVVPTAVVASWHNPPELEIRFDMIPSKPDFENGELPVNWALRFIHNQLFHHFKFPSRFCPGAFHSTITRKAEFRSKEVRRHCLQFSYLKLFLCRLRKSTLKNAMKQYVNGELRGHNHLILEAPWRMKVLIVTPLVFGYSETVKT